MLKAKLVIYMKNNSNTIHEGEWLKKLIDDERYTVIDFAKKIGVSRNVVYQNMKRHELTRTMVDKLLLAGYTIPTITNQNFIKEPRTVIEILCAIEQKINKMYKRITEIEKKIMP